MKLTISFVGSVMLAVIVISGATVATLAGPANAMRGSVYAHLAIQSGNSLPRCVYCPSPIETKKEKKKGVRGTVRLKVAISAEGLPTRVDVVKSLSIERDEEAVIAVKKWRFEPARTVDGDAVESTTQIEVTFAPWPPRN
jgi:TonB family protein